MTTLATGALTLADWAKRQDPKGVIPAVAELLSQSNEILEDIVMKEGNLPTGHRVVIRTGLPTVYFRMINAGVPTSKSTTAQVDEGCGMMEARSHIDTKLAELNGNSAAFRLSEDTPFLEAMNQTMADTLFYGNVNVDPKTFTGLATRYSSLSAGNAQNILDAGGSSTDNTSVYFVVWGEETVFGIFPKGSTAGLRHRDLGEESVQDSNLNFYQALRTLYQWDMGLVVKDWRYVVRICNIDISDLVGITGTQAATVGTELIKLMAVALDRVPNLKMGRGCYYANRTIVSRLRIQAMQKTNSVLSIEDGLNQFGAPGKELRFMGYPVRKSDRLINLETRVT